MSPACYTRFDFYHDDWDDPEDRYLERVEGYSWADGYDMSSSWGWGWLVSQ